MVLRPVIYYPDVDKINKVFKHQGDSGRELVREWEKLGLVNICKSPIPFMVWDNKFIMYDFDTDYQLINSPIDKQTTPIYTGNELIEGCNLWTYWSRHPKVLHEHYNMSVKTYEQRDIDTIFIGNIENSVQAKWRSTEWGKYISRFHMTNGPGNRTFSHEEYLKLLAKSKYGLCLRGYGPKCNREIELLALGTVLIVTPGVDPDNYINPLQENLHYIRVDQPKDIPEKISNISNTQWHEMSAACRLWYNMNSSPYGSFKLTRELAGDII